MFESVYESTTFSELLDYITSVQEYLMLAIIILFLMLLVNGTEMLGQNVFTHIVIFSGFILMCIMICSPVSSGDDETHTSEWIFLDSTDESIREYFIDCDILMTGNPVVARECVFENCTFYENDAVNGQFQLYDSLILNLTMYNNDTGGIWQFNLYDSSISTFINIQDDENRINCLTNGNNTHSYVNNTTDYAVDMWALIGFNSGNYHFYQIWSDENEPLYTLYFTDGSYYFQEFVYFNHTYDILCVVNDTLGLNYTVNGLSKIDLHRIYGYDTENKRVNNVEYQVIGLYNGIWRYVNTTCFNKDTYYNFFPVDLIILNIHTFNSLGYYENNVDVAIIDNNTGLGYYIKINSQDNITVQPSTDFLFLCAGNADTLEKRIFSLSILVNTTIYIYLNLTSTIDYDKALIDYQYEKEKELAIWEMYIIAMLIVGILIFIILYKWLWSSV